MKSFKSFDAFVKIEKGYQQQSFIGGIITIIITIFSLVLLFGEIQSAFTTKTKYNYVIDATVAQKLEINLDISIAMPCSGIHVSLLDVAGTAMHIDNFVKLENAPFNFKSAKVGHMNSIRQFIRNSKKGHKIFTEHLITSNGCHIKGIIEANKIQGILQILPANHHSHNNNFTHQITRLSFGVDYPGIDNPLDYIYEWTEAKNTMFQYFLSLVPTIYTDLSGNSLLTNQYAVTEYKRDVDHSKGSHGIPGIFFKFDLESILVGIKETRPSFLHFLTRVCGIIGGIYVSAGIVHRVLYKMLSLVGLNKKMA